MSLAPGTLHAAGLLMEGGRDKQKKKRYALPGSMTGRPTAPPPVTSASELSAVFTRVPLPSDPKDPPDLKQ